MKTNFVVAGTHKGGLATLHRCIAQHPQVCVNDENAASFFDNDALFERGTPSYDSYHTRFKHHVDHVAIGEVAANYLYWQESIPRICRYNPKIKVIVLLRNPIDRAYAHWQSNVTQGVETKSFVEAINAEHHRLKTLGKRGQHLGYSYLAKGLYSHQIRQLYQYFDPHQLLFVKSEDFKENTSVMLYRIMQFLEVAYIEVEETAQNIGSYHQRLDAKVRNELIEIYRRDIYLVEELLGWNCSNWLQPGRINTSVTDLYPVQG